MQAILALEDGTIFPGEAFGATGTQWGEVVFNTGMNGYQEVLTDACCCGQIVVMTYPLIGNYGITKEDFNNKKIHVRSLVVREVCEKPSNWRYSETVDSFLKKENVIGLSGVDTRALTRRLRSFGTMRGVICAGAGDHDAQALVERAKNCPHLTGQDLISGVAPTEIRVYHGGARRVILLDFGAGSNIIRCLQERDCEVVVVPPKTTAKDILAANPDGIVLSGGPGDPVDAPYAVETVRELIGKKPLLGICLGHLILGLALGAMTYKMKFGHRGANHPVKDLDTGRVYITFHNHGFSIEETSMKELDIYVSHRNLNDGTVEGFKHNNLPVLSVQFHPEALPGPQDSVYIFDQFIAMMAGEGR